MPCDTRAGPYGQAGLNLAGIGEFELGEEENGLNESLTLRADRGQPGLPIPQFWLMAPVLAPQLSRCQENCCQRACLRTNNMSW